MVLFNTETNRVTPLLDLNKECGKNYTDYGMDNNGLPIAWEAGNPVEYLPDNYEPFINARVD